MCFSDYDITSLCVEQGKRSLLDTDFTSMTGVKSVADMAKYYYGTVGYTIGDTKIKGFSDTYSAGGRHGGLSIRLMSRT
jgi:hypothetical protein